MERFAIGMLGFGMVKDSRGAWVGADEAEDEIARLREQLADTCGQRDHYRAEADRRFHLRDELRLALELPTCVPSMSGDDQTLEALTVIRGLRAEVARLTADNAHLLATLRKAEDHVQRLVAEVERLRAFAAQASPVLGRLNISGTVTTAYDEHDIDAALHILLGSERPYVHGVAFEHVEAWREGTAYKVPDAGGGDD